MAKNFWENDEVLSSSDASPATNFWEGDEPAAKQALPEGVKPSTAGGGRGAVNPPRAVATMSDEEASKPAGAMGKTIERKAADKRSLLERSIEDVPVDASNEAQRAALIRQSRRANWNDDQTSAGPVATGSVRPADDIAATRGADYANSAVGSNPVGRVVAKVGTGISQGLGGIAQAAGDLTGIEPLARMGKATAEGAQAFEKGMGKGGDIEGFGPRSPVPYLAEQAEGAGTSLGQSAVIAAGVGARSVIGVQAVLQGGQAYNEGRQAGLTPAAALARAVPQGAFEAIGEKFQGLDRVAGAMGTLLKQGAGEAAKRTAADVLVRAGIKEVPGEVLTYLGQSGVDLLPGIGINPNMTMSQFLDGLRDTVLQSAMMGTATVGAGRAAGGQAGARAPQPSAADLARSKGFLTPEATTPSAPPADMAVDPASSVSAPVSSVAPAAPTGAAPAEVTNPAAVAPVSPIPAELPADAVVVPAEVIVPPEPLGALERAALAGGSVTPDGRNTALNDPHARPKTFAEQQQAMESVTAIEAEQDALAEFDAAILGDEVLSETTTKPEPKGAQDAQTAPQKTPEAKPRSKARVVAVEPAAPAKPVPATEPAQPADGAGDGAPTGQGNADAGAGRKEVNAKPTTRPADRAGEPAPAPRTEPDAPATYPSLAAATAHIRQQRARGTNIAAAAYVTDDGEITIAIKGTPEYERALDQRQDRLKKEATNDRKTGNVRPLARPGSGSGLADDARSVEPARGRADAAGPAVPARAGAGRVEAGAARVADGGRAAALTDRPLAAKGLNSYRYKGPLGWVMIGAKDDADALKQAKASITDTRHETTLAGLERWDGNAYAPATTTEQRIDAAANEAATSALNDTPEPTQAQKEAGNYKMGHLSGEQTQGIDITIENPKDSTRSGTSPDGTKWSNTMGAHYGYAKRSLAADGDHVDVFVGPAADRAPTVWVIDQVNADGSYDEAKALFGFMNKGAALKAYKSSYAKGWKVGPVTEMPVADFKAGLESGLFKKPLNPEIVKLRNSAISAQSSTATPAAQSATQNATTATEKAQSATEKGANATPKPKRELKADRLKREADEARAAHFAPGKVVRGYGDQFDKVISYQPADAEGHWSVTVQRVKKVGSAKFEDIPGEQPRTHSTQPDARAFKAGAAGRMAVPAAPTAPAPAPAEAAPDPAEQRRATAEAEKKRRAAGDRARARAWDANPGRAFIAKHGIALDLAGEWAPGAAERRAAMVQGYGPIFRKSGMQLDTLAEAAVEEGFLREADDMAMHALIERAIRGERVIPQYAEGVAEDEMEARIARQRELEQDAYDAVNDPLLSDEFIDQISDDAIPWDSAADLTGATESEIQAIEDEQRASRAAGRAEGDPGAIEGQPGAAQAPDSAAQERRGRGGEPASAEAALDRPTVQDVVAQQERAAQGERAEAKARREREAKADADAQVGEFSLTGSDRVADQNADQGTMFSVADQTDTPAFKKWFGDSKVTDARGKPLVVYHGTPDARFLNEDGVFATMRERMLKFGATPESKRAAMDERAFFFTDARHVAQTYANPHRAFDYQAAEPGVVPVFVSIKNPLVFNAKGKHWREAQKEISKEDFVKQAKKAGHDGVVIERVRDSYDSRDTGRDPLSTVYVAFESSQIKHAERNSGTFDPKSDDIRMRTAEGTATPVKTKPASTDHEAKARRLLSNLQAGQDSYISLNAVEPDDASDAGKMLAAVRLAARRLFGHEVVFVRFNSPAAFNGAMSSSIPNTVFIRVDSSKPHMAILGHELLHSLRQQNPGLYSAIEQRLNQLTNDKTTKFYRGLQAKYEAIGRVPPEGSKLREELYADIVGDNFLSPEFWDGMAADQRGLFRRVADAIVRFLDRVIASLANSNPFGTAELLKDAQEARRVVIAGMRAFSDEARARSGLPPARKGESLSVAAPAPAAPAAAPTKGNPALTRAIFGGSMEYMRDQNGKPVKVKQQIEKYKAIDTDERGQMLLRQGHVTADQLKRWKASPLDVFNGAVNSRFKKHFESPGIVWRDEELRSIFKLDDDGIAAYRTLRASADTSIARHAVADMLRLAGKDGLAVREQVLGEPLDVAAVTLRDHLLTLADQRRAPPPPTKIMMTDAERAEALARAVKLEAEAQALADKSPDNPPASALAKRDEAKKLRADVGESIPKPPGMTAEARTLTDRANAVIDILDRANDDMGQGYVPDDMKAEGRPNPWESTAPTTADRIIYELQDGRIDLKRTQEAIEKTGNKIREEFDARLAETLYSGRVAKRTHSFLDGEAKPLLRTMAMQGIGQTELGDYLHARAAPERNAQIAKVNPDMPDGGAGANSQGLLLTDAAAKKYIADIAPERRQKLEALAQRVDAITKGTRSLLVTEGLEKADTIAAWEAVYKTYVPMFREDVEFSRITTSKRATGSEKKAVNILANVLLQREAAITRAEKNRVKVAMYGLALTNPNPNFWVTIRPETDRAQIAEDLERMGIDPVEAEAGMGGVPTITSVDPVTNQVVEQLNPFYRNLPTAINLKINGEHRVLLLNEEDPRALRMANAMKGQDNLTQFELAGSIVGKTTRWLAAVNTQYNPVFGIVNFMRDTMGGVIHLGNTPLRGSEAKVIAGLPGALKGIGFHLAGNEDSGKWSKLFEQFQNDGGQTGFREMFADGTRRAEAVEKDLARMAQGRADPRRMARGLFSLLSGFNEVTENAVRLSAYAAALDKGMSRPEAARLARELTVDFNRKGRATREISPLFAFFNAAVQGNERTLRALRGPTGKYIIAGGLALGVAQALMLAAAGYDDDEIPEYVKARALVIPLFNKEKSYILIPLPLGMHVIPNTGRAITEMVIGNQKNLGKKTIDAIGEISGAFNPLGGGNIFTMDGALRTILPTVIDPLVELGFNKNFAGTPIEREARGETDVRPGFQRARESTLKKTTGQAYLGISKVLNKATGGTDYEAGAISPTPERLRYLSQVALGGVLREFEKIVDTTTAKARGEKTSINSVPVASRFYGEVDADRVQQSRYYENVKRVDRVEAAAKAAKKAGDAEAYQRIVNESPLYEVIKPANKVEQAVRKLNKQAVQVIGDREAQAALDAQRVETMKQLNDGIRELEAVRRGPTIADKLRVAK